MPQDKPHQRLLLHTPFVQAEISNEDKNLKEVKDAIAELKASFTDYQQKNDGAIAELKADFADTNVRLQDCMSVIAEFKTYDSKKEKGNKQ